MKAHLVLLAAAAMLAGVAGAQEPAGPGPGAPAEIGLDRVAAVVGDSVILQSDVEQQLQQQLLQLRQAGRPVPDDSAEQAKMARDILDNMVNIELLLQEAQREKIEVTDDEVSSTVDQTVQQIRSRFASDSEYRAQLAAAGFGSPLEFRRFQTETQKRQLMQQKLFEKLRGDGKLTSLPVSQAEVDSAFTQLKASRQLPPLPATVTFRQIIVAPQPSAKEDSVARAKADSLLAEIQRGGDFAQIAKRESMDLSSKELGGDLGWQRRGKLLPLFERVIFSLPPGRVSPVFRTSLGYHIVKVERAQPAEVKVRQILIRPHIDSADVARARSLADSIARLWRAGANYDTLVAKYHDPAESRVIPNPFPRAQLPQTYQDAFAGKKPNDITDPFAIEDKSRGAPKFVIAQLTSVQASHDPTLADYQEKIRAQLGQERAFEKYIDGLRKSSFVSIRF